MSGIRRRIDSKVSLPRPGQANDRLHEDRPGEELAELEADHRDEGDQRVAGGCLPATTRSGMALGPGGADVVRLERIDHARAHQAAVLGDVDDPERQRRQNEVADDVET